MKKIRKGILKDTLLKQNRLNKFGAKTSMPKFYVWSLLFSIYHSIAYDCRSFQNLCMFSDFNIFFWIIISYIMNKTLKRLCLKFNISSESGLKEKKLGEFQDSSSKF